MTDVFVSRGGAAYRGIEALRSGDLRTKELAAAMGVIPRRVHAYMRWALDAQAVLIVERGHQGGRESVWSIGPTPAVLAGDDVPTGTVRCSPPAASVFEWRPNAADQRTP